MIVLRHLQHLPILGPSIFGGIAYSRSVCSDGGRYKRISAGNESAHSSCPVEGKSSTWQCHNLLPKHTMMYRLQLLMSNFFTKTAGHYTKPSGSQWQSTQVLISFSSPNRPTNVATVSREGWGEILDILGPITGRIHTIRWPVLTLCYIIYVMLRPTSSWQPYISDKMRTIWYRCLAS